MPMQGILASAGMKPTTPTIGTATDGGTGTTVSVAFTPSTYIGKGTITYTATSSPGSLTGTGSSSPITVSGLTTGTAYTFTVKGTTNYGVVSDSSAASNSVTPASPSSFESIASATPTSGQTVTFSSIPQTYKHLQLRITLVASGNNSTFLRMNNDTGATSYSWHYLTGGLNGGANSTTYGGSSVNDLIALSGVAFASANSTYPTSFIIDIIDYTNTNKYKTTKALVGINQSGGASELDVLSGAWKSTNAVNRLDFFFNGSTVFNAGSVVALYGIKG